MSTTEENIVLEGVYHTWGINGSSRRYATLTMTFERFLGVFRAKEFNALTGQGQQRAVKEAHAKKLLKEMLAGKYTPTSFAAALEKAQRKDLVLNEDGSFTLEVNPKKGLPLIDGNHRTYGIKGILEQLEKEHEEAEKEGDEKKMEHATKLHSQVLNLPIDVMVHFDGDPQEDFANLQKGLNMDKAQMTSMLIRHDAFEDPNVRRGFDIATHLHKMEGSPFTNIIKFDARTKLPLPVNTICSVTTSDQSVSLVGLARMGFSPEYSAGLVVAINRRIKETSPKLYEKGKFLTPLTDGGKLGGATMLIGLATCLAFQLSQTADPDNPAAPSDEELDLVVEAAKDSLDEMVNGNFSSPVKRTKMGEFAQAYFAKWDGEKVQGVPKALLELLSYSCYGVEKPKKDK